MTSKYVLILMWIALCAVFAYSGRFSRMEYVEGRYEERYRWWFAFLVFVPVVWMAAHRGNFADTTIYLKNFSAMPTALNGIQEYMQGVGKDPGFSLLSCLLKIFITRNNVIYLGILATIQVISLSLVFRTYSPQFIISVFLFIASADYISWMFNGLRQFMAVTIIFFATPWMLERKYIRVLLMIILASTMHFSALIMIPIVLIAQGKVWNKRTIAYIVGILLAVFFVERFTNLLDDALTNTQYSNVVSDYISWQDDGTNPLRVLVYSLPAVIAFITRHTLERYNNRLINFCTNMSIISAGLYLLSSVTSGIFIGRLPIYASLYGYILLPWELDNLFSSKSRSFLYMVMIAGYLMYYVYQMHFAWSMF